MTIKQELVKDVVDSPYVELYIFDGRNIDPTLYFLFTPSSDTPLDFGTYGKFTPFPLIMEGSEVTTDQQPRPRLTVANVTKVLQPFIQQYQDLANMKVTRIRTLSKFLDDGIEPDDTQHLPIEKYFVNAISSFNKTAVVFELVSSLDIPNVKFPRGQALRDDVGIDRNMYAPGLSTVRFRG